MSLIGIFNNFLYLFLSIISAVWFAIKYITSKMIYFAGSTMRTDFGKFWKFLYLYPPTLIIGQVPMECIHFQIGHLVK